MNSFWVRLSPDTFIFIDRAKLLLYHIKNHKCVEVDNNAFVSRFFDHMSILDNLYCMEISEQDYLLHHELFKAIEGNEFGDCVKTSPENKPVSYSPVCKIHKSLEMIKADYNEHCAGYILNFLLDLTIYLSDVSNDSIVYAKQIPYQIKNKNMLDCAELLCFMDSLKGANVKNLSIGCSLKALEKYYRFFDLLKRLNYRTNFIISSNEYRSLSSIPDALTSFHMFVIYTGMEPPIEDEVSNHIFIVTNTSELEHALSFRSVLDNMEIHPAYTGDNIEFFKDNVFTTKENLFSLHLTKRELFARKEINTNFFGKITVLPDGNIYSNLQEKPLGTIKDSLYEMLYKELTGGFAWMLTRDKKEPCAQCRFKFLCPPISNYEFAIGKFNLCHLTSEQ